MKFCCYKVFNGISLRISSTCFKNNFYVDDDFITEFENIDDAIGTLQKWCFELRK